MYLNRSRVDPPFAGFQVDELWLRTGRRVHYPTFASIVFHLRCTLVLEAPRASHMALPRLPGMHPLLHRQLMAMLVDIPLPAAGSRPALLHLHARRARGLAAAAQSGSASRTSGVEAAQQLTNLRDLLAGAAPPRTLLSSEGPQQQQEQHQEGAMALPPVSSWGSVPELMAG